MQAAALSFCGVFMVEENLKSAKRQRVPSTDLAVLVYQSLIFPPKKVPKRAPKKLDEETLECCFLV